MLIYLLKTTVCWTAFFLVYHLLLRKVTFFHLNRWYLLMTAMAGLLIPAMEIQEAAEPVMYYLEPITIGVSEAEAVIQAAPSTIDLWQLLGWVYVLGGVVALARLLYGFYQIGALYRSGTKKPGNGYRIVRTDRPHAPFSFFHLLFWSTHFQVDEEDRRSIMRHEEAHIFQWHSLDVLFFEITAVLCWFIPPIYWYKKAMKTTHEYLADAHVTRGCSKKQYGRLLLRQSHSGTQIAISNALFSSQLKQRIVMMTKNASSRQAVWKYFAALPVLAMLLLAFSFTSTNTVDALPLLQAEPAVLPAPTDSVPDKTKAPQKQAQQPKSEQKVAELFDVDELPVMGTCASLQGAERSACSDKELMTYIGKNLRYPEAAKKAGVQGVAAARFVIAADGSVTDIAIVKGLGSGCDEELTRILKAMPKWVPGKKDGKPVAVAYTLPVKFKLDDQPKQETTTPKVDQMPRFAGCKDAGLKPQEIKDGIVAKPRQKIGNLVVQLHHPRQHYKV